jgi:2-C-methyl-D-erythritol 4-phosphate cytidylyltransferase
MSVIAIIPAAGMGTRMASARQSKTSKQFFEIGGVPILVRTLRHFADCEEIDQIVIALRQSEIGPFQSRLTKEPFVAKVTLVEGGENRQESVYNALKAVTADPDDIILVHDAVRPFIETQIIHNVIASARKHGAAIAGLPAVDTVKLVERTSEGAIISSTVPRERVVMAQTPQGFRYEIIRKAFDDAAVHGFTGTDEASLAERTGAEVAVVMGSPRNIKITTPADMEIAELYVISHPQQDRKQS